MYEKHYGLKVKPFELVPNPEFFFQSASHQKALNYLRYGIGEKSGFILLTGEVGAGKTTLIRSIIRELDTEMPTCMIFNTRVNSRQLLALVNEDFGLEVGGKDKLELLRDLNDYLLKQHADGKHPIIIIDEAQNLSDDALEEIRLLSNLEGEDFKLVQIILVGQPELKEIIAQPSLRQLRQRINISCHLENLTFTETRDYILYRLEKAGNRDAIKFQKKAFELIHERSGGIPRLINIFCDFILLSAFAEEKRVATPELVLEVINDVGVTVQKQEPVKTSKKKAEALPEELEERLRLLEQGFVRLSALGNEARQSVQRLSVHENALRYLNWKIKSEMEKFEKLMAGESLPGEGEKDSA